MDLKLVDEIATRCIEMYNKLPKTGKPTNTEWTVLSAIVKIADKNEIEVISLGTGSKCIGATKMCPRGLILNDSHAEVMARRGFLLYLYNNIENLLDNKDSIFLLHKTKVKLKSGIQFAFFSSQLPCGDASIIPKTGDEQQFGDLVVPRKRKAVDGVPYKLSNIEDIHRTGAKCLPEGEQDLKSSGIDYHKLGQVRTKPGRGDRTLSVSCSDKLARWIHCGIQGSLLNMLLFEPIHIGHFIFGANVAYSLESLKRALIDRNVDVEKINYKLAKIPQFYQSSVNFPHLRAESRMNPAPGSINWINLNQPLIEVAVQGKKLGVTKKNKDLASSSLSISKYSLFNKFIKILQKNQFLKHEVIPKMKIEDAAYDNVKSKSEDYISKWLFVKENIFKLWTVKPKIWSFSISSA